LRANVGDVVGPSKVGFLGNWSIVLAIVGDVFTGCSDVLLSNTGCDRGRSGGLVAVNHLAATI